MATDIKLNSPKQIITNELIDNRIQIAYTHTHTNRKRRRRDKYTHQNYAHVWIWNLDIHIRFLYESVYSYTIRLMHDLKPIMCIRVYAHPRTTHTANNNNGNETNIENWFLLLVLVRYLLSLCSVIRNDGNDFRCVCVCAALCVLFGNWPHWMRSKLIIHKLPLAFFASYSISSLNFSFDSPLADCFDILCTTDNLYHTISYFEFERTLREK